MKFKFVRDAQKSRRREDAQSKRAQRSATLAGRMVINRPDRPVVDSNGDKQIAHQ